ncbi:SAM-dependent methyltransferase [Stenomitos frigidus ULC18]|uniref:SAM-dependent methyltransferase n=2 Tax=Stenomitos TaxID=1844270 RepID=A0A2T1DXU7_9CYAN|nr:SAM-dependent methyltransferase [Stenomitos frigidus ULC18]
MGFYAQKVFPYLLDWSMSSETFTHYRQQVLANVQGEVLEIGFGTGLNLPYYPNRVEKITTVDPNAGANALAQKRIRASTIAIDNRVLNGENLPMADNTFDSVVSTWTLCSIANVEQALREIHRVLKPGGRFFFIEHGLSDDPTVQRWQNRLTPLQRVIADGCHLNRNIQQLVRQQFASVTLETFYAEHTPKVLGYLYQGIATKAL